jgi:hypothetical protein
MHFGNEHGVLWYIGLHSLSIIAQIHPDHETFLRGMQECDAGPCQEFRYVIGIWGVCDRQCGGGIQRREVWCANSVGLARAPESACQGLQVPARERPCNTGVCDDREPVWTVKSLGPCNPPICGGWRTQTTACECAAHAFLEPWYMFEVRTVDIERLVRVQFYVQYHTQNQLGNKYRLLYSVTTGKENITVRSLAALTSGSKIKNACTACALLSRRVSQKCMASRTSTRSATTPSNAQIISCESLDILPTEGEWMPMKFPGNVSDRLSSASRRARVIQASDVVNFCRCGQLLWHAKQATQPPRGPRQ